MCFRCRWSSSRCTVIVASPWCDEPYALIAHVRICGSRGGRPPRRPGPYSSPLFFPRDGYARVAKPSDARGSNTSWTLYGLDRRLALHSRWGYAQSKFSVNERGLTLEQVYYYGRDGRPTVAIPGITKYVNTYDEQGNQ